MKMNCRFLLTMLSLLLVVAGDSAAKQDLDTWILVDTRKMVLSVLEGNKVTHTYNQIAIGRAGTTTDKKQGDNKTPLGEFRLVRIAPKTPFHRFFGIDYPTAAHAKRALRAGTIGLQHYIEIYRAIGRRSFRLRRRLSAGISVFTALVWVKLRYTRVLTGHKAVSR